MKNFLNNPFIAMFWTFFVSFFGILLLKAIDPAFLIAWGRDVTFMAPMLITFVIFISSFFVKLCKPIWYFTIWFIIFFMLYILFGNAISNLIPLSPGQTIISGASTMTVILWIFR